MGSLIHPELGLDCRFSPKPVSPLSVGRFLADVSKIHAVSDKILKLGDYANRLQGELKKIDAFKRELPLCMILLTDAILAVGEELAYYKRLNSEPVLEQFMPIKKTCSDEKVGDTKLKEISSREKKHWMSSVQLWNADDENSNSNTDDCSSNKLSSNMNTNRKNKMGEEINQPVMDDLIQSRKSRAFVCPSFAAMAVGKGDMDVLPVAGLSLCTPGIKKPREAMNPAGSSYSKSGSSPATSSPDGRKPRRCWSPELHRLFITALQHLGGPQAATPKQIREHMQVDGLTNDEVKSHLQKYRLHMRRMATNSTSQEQFGESLKQSNGHSRSPEGPLHLSRCQEGALEDEDDE